MKQLKRLSGFLLVFLVALLLVACDEESQEAEDMESPPEISLLQGADVIAAYDGTSCWPEQEAGVVDTDEYGDLADICEDAVIPQFTEASFTPLPAGQEIHLQLEEPLPTRVDLVLAYPDDVHAAEAHGTQTIDDNEITWTPDVPAGDYILVALGFWDDAGGATYYFPVTIE